MTLKWQRRAESVTYDFEVQGAPPWPIAVGTEHICIDPQRVTVAIFGNGHICVAARGPRTDDQSEWPLEVEAATLCGEEAWPAWVTSMVDEAVADIEGDV